MASGHVNRTNRPNTWPHRPAKRREDFPCQLGAVHTWHFADVRTALSEVRYWGRSGHDETAARRRLMIPYETSGEPLAVPCGNSHWHLPYARLSHDEALS
jgi:hypothetical protein